MNFNRPSLRRTEISNELSECNRGVEFSLAGNHLRELFLKWQGNKRNEVKKPEDALKIQSCTLFT